MILNEENVKFDSERSIDESAIVGYAPSRPLNRRDLVVGRSAIIRSGTVIYLGSTIGERFETGHNVILREESVLGNDVKIWSNTVVDYRSRIGNNVKIHCNCYVGQQTIIEDDVFLAPGVMIANEKYPTGRFAGARIEGPVIRRGARVGINSTILPGISIGEDSLVGAGSVVSKDVPAGSVVFGVPARVLNKSRRLRI